MSASAMYRHRYGGPRPRRLDLSDMTGRASEGHRFGAISGRVVEEMFGAELGEPSVDRLSELAESYAAAVRRSGIAAVYCGPLADVDYHGDLSLADEVAVMLSGVRDGDLQGLRIMARHSAEGPVSVRFVRLPLTEDCLVVFGTHFPRR